MTGPARSLPAGNGGIPPQDNVQTGAQRISREEYLKTIKAEVVSTLGGHPRGATLTVVGGAFKEDYGEEPSEVARNLGYASFEKLLQSAEFSDVVGWEITAGTGTGCGTGFCYKAKPIMRDMEESEQSREEQERAEEAKKRAMLEHPQNDERVLQGKERILVVLDQLGAHEEATPLTDLQEEYHVKYNVIFGAEELKKYFGKASPKKVFLNFMHQEVEVLQDKNHGGQLYVKMKRPRQEFLAEYARIREEANKPKAPAPYRRTPFVAEGNFNGRQGQNLGSDAPEGYSNSAPRGLLNGANGSGYTPVGTADRDRRNGFQQNAKPGLNSGSVQSWFANVNAHPSSSHSITGFNETQHAADHKDVQVDIPTGEQPCNGRVRGFRVGKPTAAAFGARSPLPFGVGNDSCAPAALPRPSVKGSTRKLIFVPITEKGIQPADASQLSPALKFSTYTIAEGAPTKNTKWTGRGNGVYTNVYDGSDSTSHGAKWLDTRATSARNTRSKSVGAPLSRNHYAANGTPGTNGRVGRRINGFPNSALAPARVTASNGFSAPQDSSRLRKTQKPAVQNGSDVKPTVPTEKEDTHAMLCFNIHYLLSLRGRITVSMLHQLLSVVCGREVSPVTEAGLNVPLVAYIRKFCSFAEIIDDGAQDVTVAMKMGAPLPAPKELLRAVIGNIRDATVN